MSEAYLRKRQGLIAQMVNLLGDKTFATILEELGYDKARSDELYAMVRSPDAMTVYQLWKQYEAILKDQSDIITDKLLSEGVSGQLAAFYEER